MQLSISPHEADLLVGVRVIGLGLGKGLGLGLGLGLELWLTRLEADIWLQFEAHQSGAGMLLAGMTVERFNSRRGVAHFGHLLPITSKDLAPKALRRMCEPLYRRQGGRAPRPALAYQHHFGGAAADRREERKEHLKTRECGNVNSLAARWCKGCCRDSSVWRGDIEYNRAMPASTTHDLTPCPHACPTSRLTCGRFRVRAG